MATEVTKAVEAREGAEVVVIHTLYHTPIKKMVKL